LDFEGSEDSFAFARENSRAYSRLDLGLRFVQEEAEKGNNNRIGRVSRALLIW
jgi:hypothetical protein